MKEKNDRTEIFVDNDVITLVNVFSTDPSKQKGLLQLLQDATEMTMKNLPGFISANLHASLDGTKIVNYAQWRSKDDFESMLRNPAALRHMSEVPKYGKAEPHLYRVASVHHR